MKVGLVAAGLVLVAGGAVGCGGDGGDDGDNGDAAPSTTDFCGALKDFKDTFATADPTADPKAFVKTVKDAATKLAAAGTPKGIPSDAKAGYDLTIKKIKALPDDATLDDLAAIGTVEGNDAKQLDAFADYVDKTCPGLSGETGS